MLRFALLVGSQSVIPVNETKRNETAEEMSLPIISSTAEVAVAVVEDRMSSLPDEILCHILSFLPTKQAFVTSVLSKRWTHLWLSVLPLDFSATIVVDRESHFRFNDFVDSVLFSREAAGSHSIKSFCLDIEYDFDYRYLPYVSFPSVTKWVNFVVQRRSIEYLHLRLHVPDTVDYMSMHELPNSIFSCTTLVVLKLTNFYVKGFSFSSTRFGFPSLKTLHLKHIKFQEDRDFPLLLAGCPILEDLQASHVGYHLELEDPPTSQELKSLSVSKLTRAEITRCNCCYFPVKALYNLESLRIDTFMVLHTMEFMYIQDHDTYKAHRVRTFHDLTQSLFHNNWGLVVQEYDMYTEKQDMFIKGLCKARRVHHPCDDIPTFHNLTHLVLHNDWDLVVQVLQHCPKLQNLGLYQELRVNWDETIPIGEDDQNNWVDSEFVPQCLSLYLRTCIIQDFAGLQPELMLARYIMKNASVLKTMTIWSIWEQLEIERKLSPCPRASEMCQLSIY